MRFYVKAWESCPQTSALPPNVTWNIVWRTQSIGIKRSVMWPSKYIKMRLRPGDPLESSWSSPGTYSRFGNGHPSPYPTLFGAFGVSIWRGHFPHIFSQELPLPVRNHQACRRPCWFKNLVPPLTEAAVLQHTSGKLGVSYNFAYYTHKKQNASKKSNRAIMANRERRAENAKVIKAFCESFPTPILSHALLRSCSSSNSVKSAG